MYQDTVDPDLNDNNLFVHMIYISIKSMLNGRDEMAIWSSLHTNSVDAWMIECPSPLLFAKGTHFGFHPFPFTVSLRYRS